MKLTIVKTLFGIVLATAMIIFVTVAHGPGFKFVMENKEKRWKLEFLNSVPVPVPIPST